MCECAQSSYESVTLYRNRYFSKTLQTAYPLFPLIGVSFSTYPCKGGMFVIYCMSKPDLPFEPMRY